MKLIAVALNVIASVSAFKEGKITVQVGDVQDPHFANSLKSEDKFAEYKEAFGKTYATVEEESTAFDAWVENEATILEHNAKGLSYILGHNEYSDMTWDHFKVRMGLNLKAPRFKPDATHHVGNTTSPDAVDWVISGAVTPVKNQERCGSCWAFSTTGSTEGAYFIANKKLVSLSEQDLVSCDKIDDGCQGGLMDNAFGWIKENGGICAESAYPYTSGSGRAGTCKKGCSDAVTITGFADVPKGDETALKSAVAQQPVSVAIEADKSAFQLYKAGVLDNPACGKKLDHGVLVVGYGTDSGSDYWKVKNSWGATWGEEGYIRMVRGSDQCGIATQPSYPTGAKSVGPSPPGPTPPPPAPSDSHYEDPNTSGSCKADEIDIQIQGVSGSVCAPACGIFKPCPTDIPSGVTAQPQCALSDASSQKKYCALICSPSADIQDQKAADAQCGTNASCKPIQGVGLCTYDK